MLSDPTKKLTVYKASAGSGKTYQLALEYLCLALADDNAFRHILAITFTNKATKEMKNRIVSFLTEISNGSNQELITKISSRNGLAENEIVGRSKIVLRKILHNYSYFSVSTIDSFYQKILRSFTREIGLIGNFNLELDHQKVLEYAIDQVIESSRKNQEVKNWLLDFVKEKLLSGSSWDIRNDLKSLASELNNEQYKILEEKDPAIIANPNQLEGYISSLKKIVFSFENQMKKIGREAENLAKKFNLTVQDFKYGPKGVFNYFLNIQNKKNYTPGKRALEGLDSVENWYTKSSEKKETIREAVENGLMTCLQDAISYYDKQSKFYFTANSILRNIYVLGLFNEIKKAVDDYKDENDLFLLSDTNIFLKGIIEENETPFIYEKTGSWFRNFLLDEFQDTSKLQWENLKPLINNSISEGNENLLVGDAKQAIYRWRGGDWKLIEKELYEFINPDYVKTEWLETNWRSAQHIIEFNNALFVELPEIFESTFLQNATEENQEFASDFKLIYENHKQKVAEKNQSKYGFVQIDFSESETKENWKQKGLEWLKEQLNNLQDYGYSPGQIAILARTKKEGTEIVEFLNQLNKKQGIYRYDVISNESLLIKNFTAVRLIVNSMRYILDPENELVRANVAIEYFREKNDQNKLDELVSTVAFNETVNQVLPPGLISDLNKLQRYGLLDSFSTLIEIFELDKKEDNYAYLMALQDVIQKFVNQKGNDISYFLEWWEEEKDKQTLQSPENINAIQVLTIHKSKGLEFDVVVLPFFNWDIDHTPGKSVYLWAENKVDPFSGQGVVPVNYSKDLSEGFFSRYYFDEKHLTYIDNLNLCYVALTRAKRVLLIHGDLPASNGNLRNVSSILYHTMVSAQFVLNDKFDETAHQFSFGKLESSRKDLSKEEPSTSTFNQNSWKTKAQLKRRGKDYFDKSKKGRKEKINYGLIVHEILAQIKSMEETPQIISVYQAQGLLSKEDVEILIDQLDRIFANPAVKKWFDNDWVLKSECSILSPNKEELRPDRVLTKNDNAIIIDFKTGKEEAFHSIQLREYRNKLLEMGFARVEAFVLYMSTNKVKQIA